MDQKTLKHLELIINKSLKGVARKEDLKDFTIKDDLSAFVTKDDLKALATKDDLKDLATKADLVTVRNELIEYTDRWAGDLVKAVEKHKADKIVVERLENRVKRLEEVIA